MNQDETPPVPSNFGWRYILWVSWWNFCKGSKVFWKFVWANAITVLSIISAIFAAITLDPTVVAHNTFHYILIGQMVLTAVLAQIKRTPSSKDESK